jgi:hypothetical protein
VSGHGLISVELFLEDIALRGHPALGYGHLAWRGEQIVGLGRLEQFLY